MMIENVLFSRSVEAGKKKYYLDVRKAKNGSKYLSIREISEGDTPQNRESRRVMVFDNALGDFAKAFREIEGNMQESEKPAEKAAF
jgi:hypothetical protein